MTILTTDVNKDMVDRKGTGAMWIASPVYIASEVIIGANVVIYPGSIVEPFGVVREPLGENQVQRASVGPRFGLRGVENFQGSVELSAAQAAGTSISSVSLRLSHLILIHHPIGKSLPDRDQHLGSAEEPAPTSRRPAHHDKVTVFDSCIPVHDDIGLRRAQPGLWLRVGTRHTHQFDCL